MPHPASHCIYSVILEISPKDNRLSISILSIQKYSPDEDIDFLYCAKIQNKELKESAKQRKERKTILFYLKKEKQKLGDGRSLVDFFFLFLFFLCLKGDGTNIHWDGRSLVAIGSP